MPSPSPSAMDAPPSLSPSKPALLFDSPSKHGMHAVISAFTPTETRFQWQHAANSTDALYTLPTSIGTGVKKSFGTSTREDWDPDRKRMQGASAGPGAYRQPSACGRQPNSLCRNASTTAFGNAARASTRSDLTPSPGPIYALATSIGTAPSSTIGTAKRMPLGARTDGPGPNLMLPTAFQPSTEGVSPTFGTDKRMRAMAGTGSGAMTPGPMYDLHATGFQTGARITFSKAKRF